MSCTQNELPTPHPVIVIPTLYPQVQMTVMPSWEECPKVFNVIFGRVMKALKLVEVGRNKYDNKAAVSIPQHKLEVSCVDVD